MKSQVLRCEREAIAPKLAIWAFLRASSFPSVQTNISLALSLNVMQFLNLVQVKNPQFNALSGMAGGHPTTVLSNSDALAPSPFINPPPVPQINGKMVCFHLRGSHLRIQCVTEPRHPHRSSTSAWLRTPRGTKWVSRHLREDSFCLLSGCGLRISQGPAQGQSQGSIAHTQGYLGWQAKAPGARWSLSGLGSSQEK